MSQPARVQLLAFGGLKQILGSTAIELPIELPCTVAQLLAELGRRYPPLIGYLRSIRLAVNGTYAAADEAIAAGDEVALIPPVSGG
jgi:molybdopterin converting factor small subunit